MKLGARLTIATAIVVTSVAGTMGTISVTSTYDNSINQINHELQSAISTVNANPTQPLSAALNYVQLSGTNLLLATQNDETGISVVTDQDIAEVGLNPQIISATKRDPLATNGRIPYQIQSAAISESDDIVFGVSLQVARAARAAQIRVLSLVALIAIALGVLLMRILVAGDLWRIKNISNIAEEISSGDLTASLPIQRGSSEVAILNESLRNMLTTLRDALERERQTQKYTVDFFSDASHELRTPLTVIMGYSQILHANLNQDSEVSARALKHISSEIERMQLLINNLLDISELSSTTPTHVSSRDIRKELNYFIDQTANLQPNRPIRTYLKHQVLVEMSQSDSEKLFANIFSNIRRHTKETDLVQIAITSDDETHVITIDDAGPGIPNTTDSHHVRHFRRYSTDRSRESGGSGLGLSIMSAIVQRYAGSIELSQSPLGGLRTTIRLPAAETEIQK